MELKFKKGDLGESRIRNKKVDRLINSRFSAFVGPPKLPDRSMTLWK
jgi:hypothetical protein